MAVYEEDKYEVNIYFDTDKTSLNWTGCNKAWVDKAATHIENMGAPFYVTTKNGFAVINPAHVRALTAYRQVIRCPSCESWYAKDDCESPEYH